MDMVDDAAPSAGRTLSHFLFSGHVVGNIVFDKAAPFATQKLLDPATIATMVFTLDFYFHG
jgi:hypothetical protein